MAEQKDIYKNRIKSILTQGGGKGIPYKKLYASCKGRRQNAAAFSAAVAELKREGVITEDKSGIKLCTDAGLFRARVSRLNKTFGFIEREDGTEVFVPGKFLKGAMPGDTVMARLLPPRGELPGGGLLDGEVVSVVEEGFTEFSGTVEKDGKTVCIRPDTLSKELMIVSAIDVPVRVGDKVLAEIYRRGDRHSEHRVRIKDIFGDSGKAKSSADALLYTNGIEAEFPSQVLDEARAAEHKGIPADELYRRLDLRDEVIFTIDGADTKDIDDAISIEKTAKGFKLGVHIADVSHYVKKGTALDQEARKRGTSVYIADMVIPMLPKELSNGICSLNPNEERLAFSCLMELDNEGEITKYRFVKSLIRSRVKGVYSEVNKILEGEADEEIKQKYSEVINQIPVMNELASILIQNRIKRGAPEINSVESKIICDENGVCIDIMARHSGVAEGIIEEFMLAANNCAAKVGMSNHIPFVYRVHEAPTAEKLMMLKDTLVAMGIEPKGIKETSSAKDLANILRECKDDPRAPIIHRMTLRTMMKAKYSENPIGHFGLVMKEYAHFTSPIRRLADLSIHRILTDYVMGEAAKLEKRYTRFANENSARASETEVTAINAERDCEKYYAAEYMKSHVGEQFEGIISGVINSGIFVELPNTVEGRIDTFTLPEGEYEVRNGIMLVEMLSNTVYAMGDKVKVTLSAVNVGAGQIDFVLDEHIPMSTEKNTDK